MLSLLLLFVELTFITEFHLSRKSLLRLVLTQLEVIRCLEHFVEHLRLLIPLIVYFHWPSVEL